MKYLRSNKLIPIPYPENVESGDIDKESIFDYDFIDLHSDDYDSLSKDVTDKIITTADVFRLGLSDSIVVSEQKATFCNFTDKACFQLLNNRKQQLDNNLVAVIIGDESTLATLAPVLLQLGYKRIVVFTDRVKQTQFISKKIAEHYFNSSIFIEDISDYEQIEINSVASFLAVDHTFHSGEVLNNLVYFSFLSEGSTVIDFRSHIDKFLTDEAKRLQYHVITSEDLYKTRHALILKSMTKI